MREYPCLTCGLDFYSEKHYIEHFCCPSGMDEPTPAPAEPKLPDATGAMVEAVWNAAARRDTTLGMESIEFWSREELRQAINKGLRTIKPATGDTP